MSDSGKLVDLSHTIEHGLVTYKGLPAPVISDFLTRKESRNHYAPGTEFHIGRIEMVANTGTYLDSPFHRYADAPDLSELPLSSLANLDGVVIRAVRQGARGISEELFDAVDLKDKAVLVHTGWAKRWGSEQYFDRNPFLTETCARYLVESGAKLVGIDSVNIDDTEDKTRPAHSILLRANIPIVEHLCNLESLPDTGFKFFAVPVKVKNFGTFPVRAFALV